MENFSAAVTFMRANPPTKGHFLIVEELHNLDVDKKYIYLSHSQDSKKNPLPYYEKYSFMKTFVNEGYDDIEVVNSEARTLLDALYEIYNKGCNDITIVLGSDRIEDFSILVNKYNGQINKKTGNLFYQFNNIDFVQAGDNRDESSEDELSSISATKQRKLAAEGNFEEFSKGVPTNDAYLKKELYDTLREHMGLEDLKEGLDSIPEIKEIVIGLSESTLNKISTSFEDESYVFEINEGIFDRFKDVHDGSNERILKMYSVTPLYKSYYLGTETEDLSTLKFCPWDWFVRGNADSKEWLENKYQDFLNKLIKSLKLDKYVIGDVVTIEEVPLEKDRLNITDDKSKNIASHLKSQLALVCKFIFSNETVYEKVKKFINPILERLGIIVKDATFPEGDSYVRYQMMEDEPDVEIKEIK